MKKILIAEGLDSLLQQRDSFLNRSDMRIFTASSNDRLLAIHQAERVDLIITGLELPGMNIEELISLIRKNHALRAAHLIMVCANNRGAVEFVSRCKPTAVFFHPVNPALLLARAQQLLTLQTRDTFRVHIAADVDGSEGNSRFFCKCQDISATGMLIETDKRLRAGSRVVCSFFLPDAGQVRAAGELVRSVDGADGAHQYGLKFLQMMPEHRIALQGFIAAKSGKKRE